MFIEQAQAISDEFRIADHREIDEWCTAHVKMGSWSPRQGDFEPDPWMIEPLRVLRARTVHILTLVAATGGGKSTIAEMFLLWLIENSPGFTAWFCHDIEARKKFAETRIGPMLRSCQRIRRFFPANSDHARTLSILFPHMSFVMEVAIESHAQSMHVCNAILDETWLYAPGMLQQIRKRTNKFAHRRKIIELSTGSILGDETDESFRIGTAREWQLQCPACQQRHVPIWKPAQAGAIGGVIWDQGARRSDDTWSHRRVAESVRYQCPLCGAELTPDKKTSLKMNAGGAYTSANPDAEPGHESMHWDSLTSDFDQLPTVAVEFIQATEALKRGSTELLQEWEQKRMARAWEDRPPTQEIVQIESDYALGSTWIEETNRFMVVDVQADHFWVLIRMFSDDGRSRLWDYRRVDSWGAVRDHQVKSKVEDSKVAVDSTHFTDVVWTECCRYDWSAITGMKAPKGFRRDLGDGRYIDEPAQPAQGRGVPMREAKGSSVSSCFRLLVSEVMTASILLRCRAGEVPGWSTPRPLPEDYHAQMKARVLRPKRHPLTGQFVWEWVTVGRCGEHAWDCERYCLAMAHMGGLLMPVYVDDEPKETNDAKSNRAS